MNRRECLDAAAQCVLSDRCAAYGAPEDNFGVTATMWSAYLGVPLKAHDVAVLMALLKVARIKTSPERADHWTDLAGYAVCGAECATKER